MIIYSSKNKINGKIYIGYTTHSLRKRISGHLNFSNNQNSQTYFHRALRKYGEKNFEWEILCETDSFSKLKKLEIFYIEVYNKMYNLYNMTKGGDGTKLFGKKNGFYGKKHSCDTKKHWSKIRKGQNLGKENQNYGGRYSKGKNNPMFGKTHSEETKKKIGDSHKNKNYGVVGENHPMYGKCGKFHHRSKPVNQIDIETNKIIQTWESINLAEKGTGLNHIGRTCQSKNKTNGGFKWKFLNN